LEELPVALNRPERPEPRLTFAATLPLKVLPRFSCEQLLATVCGILEGTGVTAMLEPELTTFEESPEGNRGWSRPKTPPRAGLIVNGVTMTVEGHDRPAFRTAELARLDLRSWPEGGTRISRARAHVTISEVQAAGGSSLGRNFDRAAAVSVLAAAVTRLADAVAIVWHTSRRAMPAEQLAPLLAPMAQGQPPVPLWLGRVGWPAGTRGAATRGLYPFLGAEIEVASQDLPLSTAFEVVQELAVEIFRTGEFPAHGARLNYDGNTEFGVRHRASSPASARPAVVLTQVTHPVEPGVAAGMA